MKNARKSEASVFKPFRQLSGPENNSFKLPKGSLKKSPNFFPKSLKPPTPQPSFSPPSPFPL
jgi:hypothetical protein